MFLETSRYFRQKVVDIVIKDGRTVKALTLRRLADVNGEPIVIKGNDRLDIIAQRQYQNPTMFWHIADANSELDANELVKQPLRVIKVPVK
ncbi:hypothetical protein [Fischerella sp. PCC 9605]|jgi:hypothetical protein|uniref:hypothetical protein n=1 Tax=Fischerella sp. PCC 9605 TaxID=1173024 RepID=UPI0004ADE057|nr:hypothetical protein [Fischerella sp. PCC 9605]